MTPNTDEPLKVFKPRVKDLCCDHWIDCRETAKWCVEFDYSGEIVYCFYCSDHLKKVREELKK